MNKIPTRVIAAVIVICVVICALTISLLLNKNKVSNPYNSNVCWNRVQNDYWPDGCKGSKQKGSICTEALVYLTADERQEYQMWIDAGMPQIPGCTESALK